MEVLIQPEVYSKLLNKQPGDVTFKEKYLLTFCGTVLPLIYLKAAQMFNW
jgi:hypothetical protein